MSPSFLLATHEGRVRNREHAVAPNADGRATAFDFADATWDLALATRDTAPDIQRCTFTATVTHGIARAVAAGHAGPSKIGPRTTSSSSPAPSMPATALTRCTARARPLAVNAAATWPVVEVPAKSAVTFTRAS